METPEDVPEVLDESEDSRGKFNVMVGDFRIRADSRQFILYKTIILGAKALVPGSKKEVFAGYYPTLEGCLKAIPTKALLGSDAESLVDAIRIVVAYGDLIAGAMKGV